MDILPLQFRTFYVCGMWSTNKNCYIPQIIYQTVSMLIVSIVVIGQVIGLAVMKNNVDDFTETLFITFTFTSFCFKTLNFITRRRKMEDLLEDFRLPACRSKTPGESEIILDFSVTARNVFLYFLCIAHLSGIAITLIPIIIFKDKVISLPFKTYRPYENSALSFWITCAMQLFTTFYGISLNVSMDTTMYGFMTLAAGQFKLNSYRLINSTVSIKQFIEHHKSIRHTVTKIESFFIPAIVPHFFFTLLVICCSIFQISQKEVTSFEFLSIFIYILGILWGFFFYCWFGSQLNSQSQDVIDAIYSSNWLNYTIEERKNLWLSMICAQNGSSISFHGQCNLSLHTFLWIIKASYTTFSLLKHVTN